VLALRPDAARLTRIGLALLAGWILGSGRARAAPPPGWLPVPLPQTGTYAQRYLPPGVDPNGPLPAVVFLHGSGSSPEAWLDLLQPVADAAGCVVIAPRALSDLSFGIGADDAAIDEALALVGAELALDPARTALAGHSAGGAFAYVLAYGTRDRWSAVFTLSAPYRQLLAVADPLYTPPIRLYYGTTDPNYAIVDGLTTVLSRLGIPWQTEIDPGFGHSNWPATTLPDGFAFLLAQRRATAGGCVPTATRLCLHGGRFEAEVAWSDYTGHVGAGVLATASSPDSGLFWFFSPSNWELQLKVLDGCGVNGHFWVYAAGTTDVAWTLTVRDRTSGLVKTYSNPLGHASAAVTDAAFATCP